MKGNYGVMRTDNPSTDGYYIVEWESNVYTVQDDIVMKGHNPPEYAYAGEMMCKARFWNLVSKAKYWYTPMPKGEGDTPLTMKQVLMADIKLEEILENNKLPKECNKKKEKELGMLRIREEDIDELIEEIRRREQFNEEFDINSNETMSYTNEVEENN